MTAASIAVSGERLSEFLRQPPRSLSEVEVTSPPASWAPLKPLLLRLVESYRERGLDSPTFRGVPLCLFGSEWSGFRSAERTTPARGRCAPCAARRSCDFAAEVPDELLAISEAPLLQRWRDYGTAFQGVTGSDAATAGTHFVERIMSVYRGPITLEPSVLLSDAVEPSARFVVFPHRIAAGEVAEAEFRDVLACVSGLLAEVGADRCEALLHALGSLPPLPTPVGMEGRAGSWRLKVYLRVEDKTPAEKQVVLDALARSGAKMDLAPSPALHMLGLVLDERGLHTVKAYVVAHPSRREADGFPPPLPTSHPLVRLTGDRALATLDVWCRGPRRVDKWDFNMREHYLAGASAERLVAELASSESAARVRPLLVGPTYRADIGAIGVRGNTLALYIELN